MSMKLLRLGLQFFAGETKEEEDKVIIPGEEGVTSASGVTEGTPPAYTMPQNTVAAPVAQDFDTWYKANGGMDEAGYYAKYDLDPDRDYQNTVNTLNYDYQTSMATYGEQAEKMYQMGLQNSGVSDIFQANAFSSYLGNMNQAAANRITARKRNKAAYNDYVANMRAQHGQYETGIKTEYDTKLNSALAFALDRYNGYNLDSVLSELGVAGYYTQIIEAVGDKLSGIDATSLKALQAQTENNLAQSILTAFPNLTEADRSAVETMFGGMVPADALNNAFNRALTTYQSTDAGKTAAVNTFVTNWTDSFDPNEGKEVFVKKMITKEDGTLDESQRANAEAAWEQMKTDFDNKVLEATEKAKAIWGGAVGAEGVPETARVINDLINEGYTKAVATAAVNAAGFTSGNAEYYTRTRAEELYAEAYSIMFGGGNIDLSKYGSADDFAKAVKSKVADKLEKYALVGDKLDEIAKAKWQEAYDAKIWAGYDFIAKNIETMGESAINDYLKSSPNNFTEDMVNKAWAKYNGTEEGKDFTELQNQTTVNELVTKWTDSFDPNESKEAFVKKMITKEDDTLDESQRANAEAAWEQMNSAYESNYKKAYSHLLSAGLNSNSTNEAIQTILNNAGIRFDDKMIERLRASLADTDEMVKKEEEVQNNEASIAEMDKIDKSLNTTMTTQGYLTTYDYMNAYKEVEAYEAENGETEATKAKKAEYREKILAEANGYLSGDDGYNLNEAGSMLAGLLSQDAVDNWDSMSNDARRRAIISAAKGEVDKKSGLVTASELYSMVSSYVTKRVQEIVGTDNSNAKASGLADAGELVNYINSLGITKTEKNKAMEAIRRGMSFRIEYNQINWYGSVSGAEASIYGWKEDENKRIFDKEFIDKLESRFETVSHSGITEYNGKLYGKGADLNWYEIPTDGITIVGDGHTNTTEQAKGIYDLLVYMLEHENKLATDAGYIEGELPSSTTVETGGDSTSGKKSNGKHGSGHSKDTYAAIK